MIGTRKLLQATAQTLSTTQVHNKLNAPRIKAGVILKRPPLILREPSEFERIFAAQYRLPQQHQQAFKYDTTFFEGEDGAAKIKNAQQQALQSKDGVIADEELRETVERELSKMDVKSNPRHNDQVDLDVHRLDRKLDRSLYLIVQVKNQNNQEDIWQFPECGDEIQGATSTAVRDSSNDLLHYCKDSLSKLCGDDMAVWFIGRAPVAHRSQALDRTFYMKAQIFAGQVKVQKDASIKDFAWLTKEELSQYLPQLYFSDLKDTLSN
ncbi:hypothetical protein MP228_010370 [Amoeboaphelidium protococcarum]|nr:hypothetical protein MP228_010370 [Amoeboaphelidium protococcarum]